MARVKRSVTSRAYRKKILKMASGYYGRAKNCYTIAIQKVEKGLQYAYDHRRTKKRDFRSLWIMRINAGLRKLNLKYSTFFGMANKVASDAAFELPNRKMLAEMAMNDNTAFVQLVDKVQTSYNSLSK